jgi:hypothetical protein
VYMKSASIPPYRSDCSIDVRDDQQEKILENYYFSPIHRGVVREALMSAYLDVLMRANPEAFLEAGTWQTVGRRLRKCLPRGDNPPMD